MDMSASCLFLHSKVEGSKQLCTPVVQSLYAMNELSLQAHTRSDIADIKSALLCFTVCKQRSCRCRHTHTHTRSDIADIKRRAVAQACTLSPPPTLPPLLFRYCKWSKSIPITVLPFMNCNQNKGSAFPKLDAGFHRSGAVSNAKDAHSQLFTSIPIAGAVFNPRKAHFTAAYFRGIILALCRTQKKCTHNYLLQMQTAGAVFTPKKALSPLFTSEA